MHNLEIEIIAGLHTGARVRLDPQRVTVLGSDDGVDLILRDDGVGPHHLIFIPGPNGWTVCCGNHQLFATALRGRIKDIPFALYLGDEISLGSATLKIVAGTSAAPEVKPTTKSSAGLLAPTSWLVCSSGLLGALALLYSLQVHSTERPSGAALRTTADITTYLHRHGYEGVVASTSSSGLMLAGIVADTQQVSALKTDPALAPLMPLTINVSTADAISSMLEQNLKDDALQVRYQRGKTFAVSGNSVAPSMRARIARLRQDMGDSAELIDEVHYGAAPADQTAHGRTVRDAGLKIRQVASSAEPAFIELGDGEKIFEGGRVGDYEIVKIASDALSVRIHGVLTSLTLE